MSNYSTYEEIIENGIWLDDLSGGQYSRYATEDEESVWVCNICEAVDVDPYEDQCDCEYDQGGPYDR